MALDAIHPLYEKWRDDWALLRHAHAGERVVKEQGQLYLPATAGMNADGMGDVNAVGYQAYQAYRRRAVFPDFVSEGVGHLLGMMHSRSAKIELPRSMEYLRESASTQGEPLHHFLIRLNEEQLLTGRVGLLVDMPEGQRVGRVPMHLALYPAESIRNWHEELVGMERVVLHMVVLDESRWEHGPGLDWVWVERYRLLSLGPVGSEGPSGVYGQALVEGKDIPTSLITPSFQGRTLDQVPFTFINTRDNLPTPDRPPLLGLANLCMTIYRGEADYRQNLFMQGQDTFVTVGAPDTGEEGERVGAGAILNLPMGADAKYVGVQSTGLAEQRLAIDADRAMAAQRAGQLATAKSRQIESGEALQTRVASVTASLQSIAQAGAAGLERALRQIATWMGEDPDSVKIEPNTQFHDLSFDPRDIVELASAKTMGIPLSSRSIHEVLRERGYTRLTYDEELAEIEEEDPLLGGIGTTADLPDGPPSGGDTSGGSASAAAASGAN